MERIWSVIHRYFDKLSVPSNGHSMQRYGFVFLVITIFLFIQVSFDSFIGKDVPFLFELFIVTICAWFGGFGPGLLATVSTGVITYYFFLDPKLTWFGVKNISNGFILFTFFLEGLLISVMSESHRRSDKQKSEFVGIISHELKNPLTSIKGYAEIIKRQAGKNGENKLSDIAIRIDQQAKQVIDMINEMLDITKIETGRLTYKDEVFRIDDLVKEIIRDQQVTTKRQRIRFSGKSGRSLLGDRYRIGQVITNLISNAIKYAPASKVLHVRVENKRAGVLIAVQDFGAGIKKDDQLRIFDPFYRAKNTREAKGAGIGLFISSRIVAKHKGKLWVESKIGKGSTFYLLLPTIKE